MSEQPIAPIRQSSFSDAVTINALNAKLAEAQADIANWKISVQGDIVKGHSGFQVKLNISKGNGQGFITTIETPDVLYYADDPATLIDQIVEEVYDNLFKQQLRAVLGPYVTNGIKNAKLRTGV
jgi:acid phosphatase family membrane protein YuiD